MRTNADSPPHALYLSLSGWFFVLFTVGLLACGAPGEEGTPGQEGATEETGAAAPEGPTPEGAQETPVPLWGDALEEKIDSLAEANLEEGPVAALGIGVRRGDEVLVSKGYGFADVENQVPARPETVYRIGSITKQFTAAAVMQLVEAGALNLDAPMTEYLPGFPTQGHEVTIRHLLTHTSGIKSYTGLDSWRPKMRLDLSDQELVALFQDEPFDFAPGEEYRYNNSAYFLLGMIIGEVSGEGYREYLKNHLFEPLGLDATYYCDERPIIPWRAEGYESEDGELFNDAFLSMNQPGAAGALCATVPDLLTWADALRDGEVVSQESYARMTTPFTLNDGSRTEYGFGLGLSDLEGHERVAHGGGINGFNTMWAYFPEADLDIVVFSNTEGGHPDRITERIARWALGIPVPVVRDEILDPRELALYPGVYELEPGFELTVTAREGELFAQATDQSEFRLRAQGDHVFIPTFDDLVRLEFAVESDRATAVVLHQGGQVMEATRIR